jgi:fructose-1,6-bisphosphatase/inositol monophosphatase family enzyme
MARLLGVVEKFNIAKHIMGQSKILLEKEILKPTSPVQLNKALIDSTAYKIEYMFKDLHRVSLFKEDAIISASGKNDFDPRVNGRWILDSLNGRLNPYEMRFQFAVSVGYWEGNSPVFGFMILPGPKGLFTLSGHIGQGVWADDKPFKPDSFKNSCGMDFTETGTYPSQPAITKLFRVTPKIKHIGSIACGLGELSVGRLSYYMNSNALLWEIAGALPILNELGMPTNRKYFDLAELSGKGFRLGEVFAAKDKASFEKVSAILKA